MPKATYKLEIDWDNDGLFANPYSDVTGDLLEIRWDRGRDHILGKAITSTCSFSLKNMDDKYSPPNSTGPLYNKLKPFRQVKLTATFQAVTYSLWRGYIISIEPLPKATERRAEFTCADAFCVFRLAEANTDLLRDLTTGAIIGKLLDEISWPSELRELDDGQDTVPFAWFYRRNLLASIQEVEESERGFFYINKKGKATFEDRHHRIKPPHTSSVLTISDTMVDMVYSLDDSLIFNEVIVAANPRVETAEIDIWKREATVRIEAGATETIWANFVDPETGRSEPASSVITPVAYTDYEANSEEDGTGDDLTLDITVAFTAFAKSAKLEITNNASVTAYITYLRIRGRLIRTFYKITRKAEDSSSQAEFQKRTLDIDLAWQQKPQVAKDYADFMLSQLKQPVGNVKITLTNSTNSLLTSILEREISDRITVNETKTGLSADYYIGRMIHHVTLGSSFHTCIWVLENVDQFGGQWWILDYSELDVATRLAY